MSWRGGVQGLEGRVHELEGWSLGAGGEGS